MANCADSTMRTCKHCNFEKLLCEFIRNGNRPRHKCKDCRAAARRQAYKRREGEYLNRDLESEKAKRRIAAQRHSGKYIWDVSWLAIRLSKPCSRCLIELPANPAWFKFSTKNTTGLSSICRCCEANYYWVNRSLRLEESRTRFKKRMIEGPELVRGERRAWRATNPEKGKAYANKWRQENLEEARLRQRANQNRRRAAENLSTGTHSSHDITSIKKSQRDRCWYCQCVLKTFHVDHRIPLSRGGSNGPENLVIACPSCNLSKGAKMPWELESPRLL